jgi:CRISPR-associated protein Cas2
MRRIWFSVFPSWSFHVGEHALSTPQRQLYIAAYDIRHPKRLRRALWVLKQYAAGRQKSVFECYLTSAERGRLLREVRGVIDLGADRFFLVRPDGRCKVYTLGMAVPPADPPFFYEG